MAENALDQAASLRHLMQKRPPRIIAVYRPDPGTAGALAAPLVAQALAAKGKAVLLIEAARSDAAGLSLAACARGETDAEALIRPSGNGPARLALPSSSRDLAGMNDEATIPLAEALDAATAGVDFMVVDCEGFGAAACARLLAGSSEIVLQLRPTTRAVAAAYGFLKQAAPGAPAKTWHLVVETVQENVAGEVYRSLARTAHSFLALRISDWGCLPPDDTATVASQYLDLLAERALRNPPAHVATPRLFTTVFTRTTLNQRSPS